MSSNRGKCLTADEALRFVRERGVVLAAGKGAVPRLAEVIAGEPIRGSWWAHPKSHAIFKVFRELGESPDILICRLVGGKVTFVHRRLWAALVRLADHFSRDRLAQVRQEHTPSGHHVSHAVPFPRWVPREVLDQARELSEQEARDALGEGVIAAGRGAGPRRRVRVAPVRP
jgi:hypothetical protein